MVAERDTEVAVHFMSGSRLCKVICTVKLRNFFLCGERGEGGGQREREKRTGGREKGKERETDRQTDTDTDREKERERQTERQTDRQTLTQTERKRGKQ